jgi:hypothetical protein
MFIPDDLLPESMVTEAAFEWIYPLRRSGMGQLVLAEVTLPRKLFVTNTTSM